MDATKLYREAVTLARQHGNEAQSHILQRLRERRAAGDQAGQWECLLVFNALLKLLPATPPDGDMIH
jgi:hypothetical protein